MVVYIVCRYMDETSVKIVLDAYVRVKGGTLLQIKVVYL